ncbi:MAG: hypothetical protein CMG50_04375 [Candidatus Marinimicrobia bacterium]|nr:hypothetical protein [Candidatus Neomarinimicrobiota bacterium]
MNSFKFLLIFILLFCCNTEPIRKEITVGKTIKIEPSNFDTKINNNYNFLWSKPIFSGEKDIQSMEFKIENNKMLFTPLLEGNFDISLTVESLNNTDLYQEFFSFQAIDKDIKNKNSSLPKSKQLEITRYTIQIASVPTIDEAKEYQKKLKNNGFDAYTESLTLNNKQFWRVRVGNFTDYIKAKDIEKLLIDMNYDTWFTNIKQ